MHARGRDCFLQASMRDSRSSAALHAREGGRLITLDERQITEITEREDGVGHELERAFEARARFQPSGSARTVWCRAC
jgi:hypothetical protein